MQVASNGTRLLRQGVGVRIQPHANNPSPGVRAIHIPSSASRSVFNTVSSVSASSAPARAPSTAQRLFTHSRSLVSRFFSHLTAPGLGHTSTSAAHAHLHPHASRLHTLARPGTNTIKANLSLHARHALSRPFGTPHLPRPPVVPPNITQVGLGTARNFHSARPIFQNLVENVPIAGRALWEAELDIKTREEQKRKLHKGKEVKRVEKTAEMMKPKKENIIVHISSSDAVISATDEAEAEFNHYFPAAPVPQIATYLLIPLAPTPTSRVPLGFSTTSHSLSTKHPLLPIPEIAATHHLHRTHSLRVSTLFGCLDAAQVWNDPGVECSAYAHRQHGPDLTGESDGECTILKIIFNGWTKARVRSVIGESGSGWCALEEINEGDNGSDSMSDVLSSMDSEDIANMSDVEETYMVDTDPAHSFVLPSLDFSSSFPVPPIQAPPVFLYPASELTEYGGGGIRSPTMSPISSISDSESSSEFSVVAPPSVDSYSSWIGFSSEFAARIGDVDFLF